MGRCEAQSTGMRYYTGVGSRETPYHVQESMHEYAQTLARKGFCLRSGGASGADEAFETGCYYEQGPAEIFLPWNGFNDKTEQDSSIYIIAPRLERWPLAQKVAERVHPAWDRCTPKAKKLHSRNVFQVYGPDCYTDSEFLICWTKDGKEVGGTRTAIVLARLHEIPVYNLANPKEVQALETILSAL